jgi:hypothetical protein
MNKTIIISIITTALIYSSCGSSENKNAATTEQTSSNNTPTTVPDFTKSFEGTINSKYGIILTLTKNANNLNGTYAYKIQGTPIKISGTIDNNRNLIIKEFNDKGKITGIFKGKFRSNKIIGQWTKPDGSMTMPFSISEYQNSETTFTKEQNSINFYQYLPKGYQLKDVNGKLGPASNFDFDKDGIKDLAIILFDEKYSIPIFCFYLSSNFKTTKTFKYCDWKFMMHTLNYENGMLSLFSDNGSMGQYGSIEMKYDTVKKDFKIIKYKDNAGNNTKTFKLGRI